MRTRMNVDGTILVEAVIDPKMIFTNRERYVVGELINGKQAKDIAAEFGVTPGCIAEIVNKFFEKIGYDKKFMADYFIKNQEFEEDEVILEDLDLSVRCYNVLKRLNMTRIRDFDMLRIEQLADIRTIGRKSCTEIIAKLCDYGFVLCDRYGNVYPFTQCIENGVIPFDSHLEWPTQEKEAKK